MSVTSYTIWRQDEHLLRRRVSLSMNALSSLEILSMTNVHCTDCPRHSFKGNLGRIPEKKVPPSTWGRAEFHPTWFPAPFRGGMPVSPRLPAGATVPSPAPTAASSRPDRLLSHGRNIGIVTPSALWCASRQSCVNPGWCMYVWVSEWVSVDRRLVGRHSGMVCGSPSRWLPPPATT